MRGLLGILLMCSCWDLSLASTLTFDRDKIILDTTAREIHFLDWALMPLPCGVSIPVREFSVGDGGDLWACTAEVVDTLAYLSLLRMGGATTSLEENSSAPLASRYPITAGNWNPISASSQMIDGRIETTVLISPVRITEDGTVLFAREIQIQSDLTELAPLAYTDSKRSHQTALGSGAEYVIVTSAALAEAYQELAVYRREGGVSCELITVDSILAQYGGNDSPDAIRNYLKDFYAQGGRYVLLGGDEVTVPVRYAYDLNTATVPPMDSLQICDLYYADLTGDWDLDGDGVYGEKNEDAANLTPELAVGRLPLRTSHQVAAYIAKLKLYESAPGHGDPAYLSSTLFFSSDQMRDWGSSGQHGTIAGSFPAWFTLDTALAVEALSGLDAAPSSRTAPQVTTDAGGYGIYQIIAHGRHDGFAVRTSGYNEWPKSLMLTAAEGSGHGCIDSLFQPGKPSFIYSLACDNAAFDFDQPPFSLPQTPFCEEVLANPDGAVGLVGYSRWGWVFVSHLLERAFFDSLFAHPERPAIEAMHAAKAAYSYYRDIQYGQNFLGDPLIHIYTETPQAVALNLARTSDGFDVTMEGTEDVSGIEIAVTKTGEIVASGITDGAGRFSCAFAVDEQSVYIVTAWKPNMVLVRELWVPSVVTDVVDDGSELPVKFALEQNYPNPFNPSTTISFALAEKERVELRIFDVLGRQVANPVDEILPAGNHTIAWQAQDDQGRSLPSGVYFYRLESGALTATRKMVLLR